MSVLCQNKVLFWSYQRISDIIIVGNDTMLIGNQDSRGPFIKVIDPR